MERFFGEFFFGEPFRAFSPPHLAALALILCANAALVLGRRSLSAPARRRGRAWLAGTLLFTQLSWMAWAVSTGQASVRNLLPLHLCSLFMFVTAAALLTRSRTLFEYSYFLGGGGALFALLTPDIGRYNFPHFVFFQSLLGHGCLLTAQVYLAAVEGLRPKRGAIRRVFIAANLYALPVAAFNALTGSNYLFLAYKPGFPTPLDFFGPWPGYILGIEAAGLLTCLLLYLPFLQPGREPAATPSS